jgi:hypothetical protein
MPRFAAVFVIFVTLFSGTVFGQHAVDPSQRYHRLICLVHLTGSGTSGDTIRPEYVPVSLDPDSRSGILAWSSQISDDGRMAIVVYVAADRKAFETILTDKRSEIRVFEIGKHDRKTIETELRKYKKDFDLDTMMLEVQ